MIVQCGENGDRVKFIHSEKATKFCQISTLFLSYVVPVKSKVEISQNCVAFKEYMNFIYTKGALRGFFSKMTFSRKCLGSSTLLASSLGCPVPCLCSSLATQRQPCSSMLEFRDM